MDNENEKENENKIELTGEFFAYAAFFTLLLAIVVAFWGTGGWLDRVSIRNLNSLRSVRNGASGAEGTEEVPAILPDGEKEQAATSTRLSDDSSSYTGPIKIEFSTGEVRDAIEIWYNPWDDKSYFFVPQSFRLDAEKTQVEAYVRLPDNMQLVGEQHRFRSDVLLSDISIGREYILCEVDSSSESEGTSNLDGNTEVNSGYAKDPESKPIGQTVVFLASSEIPTVFIHTQSGSLEFIHADKSHEEAIELLILCADGSTDFLDSLATIKGRGNTTWEEENKPYKITLREPERLLGMGRGTSWNLLANVADPIEMRNHLVLETARQIGMEYAVQDQFADLYINGEYVGLYQLTEAIEVGEERVAIEDLHQATQALNQESLKKYFYYEEDNWKGFIIPENPEDISGGYLMEMDFPDRYAEEKSGFITQNGKHIVVTSPQYASFEQLQAALWAVQEAEHAIFSFDGVNSETQKTYEEYFDLPSWTLKFLIDEVFINVDADTSSSFMYKRKGDPMLYAGPVWDYDKSCGYREPSDRLFWLSLQNPNSLYTPSGTVAYSSWYRNLYRQESFVNAITNTYREIFLPVLTEWTNGGISRLYALTKNSLKMNHIRWNASYDPRQSDAEIAYLQNFLERRTAFLNSIWIEKETYIVVTWISDLDRLHLYLRPGETLEEHISKTLPALSDYTVYTDEKRTKTYPLDTPVDHSMTLYVSSDAERNHP